MSTASRAASGTPAAILVVDDDRRVVELMTIALNAYGYRVLTAADGEEALRVASRERPDLVVLDVRLPKRSGYEVCEMLRQDPDDPDIPIIMVSAAAETEARLQGLTRGADDYVPKPFSPKELIARIKRLLVRSTLSREARRRGREMETELTHAREDARRSHAELQGVQQIRDLTRTFIRDFHGMADEDRLAARLLLDAQSHLGSGMVALLGIDPASGALRPVAVRGDAFERAAGLEVRPGGELAALLSGLGRPVRQRELERFPELRTELAPFIAAGAALVAPLRGPEGMVGLLVAGERLDGRDLARLDLEVITVLCDTAALALAGARRCAAQAEGMLDQLEAMAERDLEPAWREAASMAAALAVGAATRLPLPLRDLIGRAIRLGEWGEGAGSTALGALAARDPSGTGRRLAALLESASLEGAPVDDVDAGIRSAVALIRFGREYSNAIRRGLAPRESLEAALVLEGARLGEPLEARLREHAALAEASGSPSASRFP
jgi:DNA-binding response OmpR family regulator